MGALVAKHSEPERSSPLAVRAISVILYIGCLAFNGLSNFTAPHSVG
jgi:hypothetical protein